MRTRKYLLLQNLYMRRCSPMHEKVLYIRENNFAHTHTHTHTHTYTYTHTHTHTVNDLGEWDVEVESEIQQHTREEYLVREHILE